MDTNNNEVLEQNNIENGNVVVTQNEVVQNQSVPNTGIENDVQQKNKKNFTALIVIALVFIALAALAFIAMSLFKSNEQKFYELLFEKQSVVMFANEMNEKAQKAGQVDSTLEIDFNEFASIMGEENDEEMVYSLHVSQAIKKENVFVSLGVGWNDDILTTTEYAKTDDIFG